MSIKPHYKEVPGSKYATIQFEFPCCCKIEDIRLFLCSQTENKNQPIENIHYVSFFAEMISQVECGIQSIKSKKETPIQMSYGICEKIFMISVSFLSDNQSMRLISKMLIEKCMMRNIKYVLQRIKRANKEFFDTNGIENLEKSIRVCQKKCKVYIMSKMSASSFNNKEESFGYKIFNKKIEEQIEKLDLKSFTNDPVPQQQIVLNPDIYIKFPYGLNQIDPVLKFLLLSSINGQQKNIIIVQDRLWIKRKELANQNRDQCDKFLKERLAFTNSKKIKPYKTLSAEAKAKTTESEYNAKQEKNLEKKQLSLLQLIMQLATCPGEQLFSLQSPLKKIQVDAQTKNIQMIKSGIEDVIKIK